MKRLFEETRITSLKIENRFVRSATWMALADPDGACNERVHQCYEDLAAGGVGLIISGFAFVSREGQGPERQLGIHADSLVDGLRVLTAKVHEKGGKIAVQIVHCGGMSKKENNEGLEVIAPSDRKDGEGNRIAREMSVEEIQRIVDDFGAAAERARAAGFDGIQLHYAHGYLGSQFLSPRHNRRGDAYGGSPENRFRFLREVYLRTREAVGEDFPVMAKLNIEDFVADGLPRAEGLRAAELLDKLGLDAIEVSGGTAESGRKGPARRIKEEAEEAYFLENALAIKERCGMPVLLVGGLRTPSLIAKIHEETGIDYFSLSRPFIREPHLVRRWKEGDTSKAACVSCSKCFLSVKQGKGIFCMETRKNGADGLKNRESCTVPPLLLCRNIEKDGGDPHGGALWILIEWARAAAALLGAGSPGRIDVPKGGHALHLGLFAPFLPVGPLLPECAQLIHTTLFYLEEGHGGRRDGLDLHKPFLDVTGPP